MACVSQPELDDRALLLYLDGQASAEITAHIEQCSHCRERAQRLAQQEGLLITQLYRVDCPSPSKLGEYHLGVLPLAQRDAIRRHLEECPLCRSEVAQLEGYLDHLASDLEPGPLQQVVQRIQVLVARLVGGGSGGSRPGQLALAGVRGDDSGAPLVYHADEVQVIVEVETDAERPDHRTLLGLVVGLEPGSLRQAHLWKAEQRVTATPVDELGSFFLSALSPGTYELILAGPELEIHVQHIQVGDVEQEHKDSETQ
jgi:hypothetical protein